MTVISPFRLEPQYRDYLWGGDRLRPGHAPTAEAWVVYEHNRILEGPLAGQTLGEAAAKLGAALLGTRAPDRFPLLIKLLDCAEWLSLQVHPNDEQAVRLHGECQFGKTEAWYFIETEPGARIIAGLNAALTAADLETSIRSQTIIDSVNYVTVHPGDAVLMRAGTVHALGPGMLVYEVQENSDWTYRIYDWGRPQTPNRKLHIQESLSVIDSAASPHLSQAAPCGACRLTACEYFVLDSLQVDGAAHIQVGPQSFQALTVVSGCLDLHYQSDCLHLDRFETVFLPAGCGEVRLESVAPAQVLLAALPTA